MKKTSLILLFMISIGAAGENPLTRLDFLLGHWQGTGAGFGNETSTIESEFNPVMNGRYIEIKNESHFKPTAKNPEGEHHIDWGMISYDKDRNLVMYRQFNNEGYVNRYVLVDSLSSDSSVVFLTEAIENFVPGGKARFTINKKGENAIETVFDVSFSGRDYACFGTNNLTRKQ